MWSAALIREARLRAGLTQQQLADRTGRKRSVIARWERNAIAPSLDTLLEIIAACGFEIPLELVPRDDSAYEQLRRNVLLSPERRLEQLLTAHTHTRVPFDPYAILGALERHRAAYVVIGAFGRIVQGADETTDEVDIVPSLRGDNPQRLARALGSLDAVRVDGLTVALGELSEGQPIELETSKGTLKIVPEPAGTRGGYDDLRRAATQQPIGRGLRIAVASSADLARMLAALGRETDLPKLMSLRRLQTLEHTAGYELEL